MLKILNRNKSRTYRQTEVNLSTKNQYLNRGLIELRNSLSKKHRRSKYQRMQKGDGSVEDSQGRNESASRNNGSVINIEVSTNDEILAAQNRRDAAVLKNIE